MAGGAVVSDWIQWKDLGPVPYYTSGSAPGR